MWLPALLLAMSLANARPELPPVEEADPPPRDEGFDGLGVPIVSYNSDVGFGAGVVGGVYFYAPGYRPYRHGIALQSFFTTRGIQSHFLRYDGPRLLGPLRVEARLEFRRELYSPFYGPGNRSAPDFSGDLRDERWNFVRTSPGGWVRLRHRPWGEEHPLELYGGYVFRHTSVGPYDGSLLEESRPPGSQGGATGGLIAGAVWDTRDDESTPTRGGAEEVSLRASAGPLGSHYTFGGLTLSERRLWTLWDDRLWFAQRLVVDWLFGDVPFFEWQNVGGINYTEGIGGMSSVRGVPRARFAGNVKVFGNSELRFRVTRFTLFKRPVQVGGVAFVDLGRVWHPGVEDGPWHAWHPGVGGGLRLWRRAAVIRVDYALATEDLRQGIYVTFGHMF